MQSECLKLNPHSVSASKLLPIKQCLLSSPHVEQHPPSHWQAARSIRRGAHQIACLPVIVETSGFFSSATNPPAKHAFLLPKRSPCLELRPQYGLGDSGLGCFHPERHWLFLDPSRVLCRQLPLLFGLCLHIHHRPSSPDTQGRHGLVHILTRIYINRPHYQTL